MHEFKELSIWLIYLDNENARHEPFDNEPAVIAHLVATEKVEELATDIATKGSLNPLDRLAVFPHPTARNAYVSAEGNRRICALKLLHDPEKAPNTALRKKFRLLSSKLDKAITKVECVEFESFQAAAPWVALRHDGYKNGSGTRQWDARSKVRFDRRAETNANPNRLADLLADYSLQRGLITREDHKSIPLTTLTRYLNNPVVRHAMGLTQANALEINVAQEEFDRVTKRFIKDAIAKKDVTSRTKRDEWIKYAEKLATEGVAPTTRLTNSVLLDAQTGSDAPRAKDKATKKDRNNPNPNTRSTVVPSSFKRSIKHKILKRVFDELRQGDADSFPFANAFLLRLTIELTVKIYCKKHRLGHVGELHVLLGKCAKSLDPTEKDKAFKPLRVMANSMDSPGSPDTLGNFVHGGAIPNRQTLVDIWDSHEFWIGSLLSDIRDAT
jgi:hypothetical protein